MGASCRALAELATRDRARNPPVTPVGAGGVTASVTARRAVMVRHIGARTPCRACRRPIIAMLPRRVACSAVLRLARGAHRRGRAGRVSPVAECPRCDHRWTQRAARGARARARAVRVAARARSRRSRARRDTVGPCGSSSTRARAASARRRRRPRRRSSRRSAGCARWSRRPTRRTASATCSARGSAPSRARSRRGLDALEIDPRVESARHWGAIQRLPRAHVPPPGHRGRGRGGARDAAGRGGAHHAARGRAARATSGAYDLLVLDCAPTDAALRLVTLPEVASGMVRLALQLAGAFSGLAVPLAKRLVAAAAARARGVRARPRRCSTATSPRCARGSRRRSTSVRLVVTPERMVIDEALRAHTELALFEVACDAVVVNRLLPDGALRRAVLPRLGPRCRPSGSPRSRSWFAPLPVLRAPLQDDEVIGSRAARRARRARCSATRAPDAVLSRARAGALRARARRLLGARAAARRRPGAPRRREARRRARDLDARAPAPAARCRAASRRSRCAPRASTAARCTCASSARPRPADARAAAHRQGRRRQDQHGARHRARGGRARPPLRGALDRRGAQPRRRARRGRSAPRPVAIAERVTAQEVSALAELDRSWSEIQALAPGGCCSSPTSLAAEELLVFPGLEELVALRAVHEVEARGRARRLRGRLRADRLDAAHAAAARRAAPSDGELLASGSAAPRALLRPVAERLGAGRLVAPESVFDAFERLYAEVESVRQILLDEDRTSARLVVNPARVVVDETRRSFAYLCLYGVATDAVLVNRVLPESAAQRLLRALGRARARASSPTIEKSFPVPQLFAPLLPERGARRRRARASSGARCTASAIRPSCSCGAGRCGSPSATARRCSRSTCRARAPTRSTSGCAATICSSPCATSSAASRCRARSAACRSRTRAGATACSRCASPRRAQRAQ